MLKSYRKIFAVFLSIAVVLLLNTYIAGNYILMMPGITRDLSSIVDVKGGMKSARGSFLLTTVSTRPANLPLAVYALMDKSLDIIPRSAFIPEGWDMNEYLEYMKRWMQESQVIAKVVALEKLGIKTKIRGGGVKVIKVLKTSRAYNKIKPGDIILEVDGKAVTVADELVREVKRHGVGDELRLKVKRDEKMLKFTVETIENVHGGEDAAIGIYVTTVNWKPSFPVNIKIDTGQIGGPSAGLMFALEIINQMTPYDLTGGRTVAGTGTINLEGDVGEIGGVRQKVITAHSNGAEYFLVPHGNFETAKKTGEKLGIKVIPVASIDEALDFLHTLNSNR